MFFILVEVCQIGYNCSQASFFPFLQKTKSQIIVIKFFQTFVDLLQMFFF